MKTAFVGSLFLVLLTVLAAHALPYTSYYGEVVWSDLTGASSSHLLRVGLRDGPSDYHLFVRNDWFDTTGTDLPFQYSVRGTTVGIGYRYWFPGDYLYATVMVGSVVEGDFEGETDVRAGFAGYREWLHGTRVSDLYGDLTWYSRAEDVFLNLRYRPGVILNQTDDGRLWAYGVGQVWASGEGNSGTDNRVEAGIGLGYLYKGKVTINAELRAGYSYRGAISDRTFVNPVVFIAGGF
ncbi:MAG: hypothetical protein ACYC7E_11190 [Armatimonadota bacterium]